jgi:hypothetical protein
MMCLFGLSALTAVGCSSPNQNQQQNDKTSKSSTFGLSVKVSATPKGITDLKTGSIVTLKQSQTIQGADGNKINIFAKDGSQPQKSTAVVAARFGQDIRLLDFYVSGANENPALTFESTARSLVLLNPLFNGISFDQRSAIFQSIAQDKQFGELTKLVSESTSIVDPKLVDVSTDIAIRIAKAQKVLIIPTKEELDKAIQASKPITPQTSSALTSGFPKERCGDSLPDDPKAYPVSFYPVFVDFSDANFIKMKSQFCKDAIENARAKVNKKSIQVGSFTDINRAKIFKDFMVKQFGSGEVGEPRIIPSKQSGRDSNFAVAAKEHQFSIWDFLDAPAFAQVKALEYKLIEQLQNNNDNFSWIGFKSDSYPLFHGVTLEQKGDGFVLKGTPILYQQVIVVPKSKAKTKPDVNDYGGEKRLDGDIVAETLLEPYQLSSWDWTSISKLLTLSSSKEFVIKPRSGTYSHGEYSVLISAGIYLNRETSEQIAGAFTMNVVQLFVDTINVISGLDLDLDKKKVLAVASVALDCRNEISKNSDVFPLIPISTCLTKPENVAQVASTFVEGLDKDIEEKFLLKLTGFQEEAWKNTLKKIGGFFNVADKFISGGRSAYFAAYLSREMKQELYAGQISIIDPVVEARAPKTIVLGDGDNTKEILDMTIEKDGYEKYLFSVKNYSNYPAEIQSEDADSFLVKPNDVESSRQTFRFYGKANTITVRNTVFGPILKYPLIVRRLDTRLPEKEITFSCDASQLPVTWGLKIKPKCLESGIYADYENYADHPLDVIVGSSIVSLRQVPKGRLFFEPASGKLRSNGRSITIKIRANLN